jgi:hypothetical protein
MSLVCAPLSPCSSLKRPHIATRSKDPFFGPSQPVARGPAGAHWVPFCAHWAPFSMCSRCSSPFALGLQQKSLPLPASPRHAVAGSAGVAIGVLVAFSELPSSDPSERNSNHLCSFFAFPWSLLVASLASQAVSDDALQITCTPLLSQLGFL